MIKAVLNLALLVTALDSCSVGRLITTPMNTVFSQYDSNYSLNCSSSLGSVDINWYFITVDETIKVMIATESVVRQAFTNLYWIDQPTPYASNLFVRRASEITAGTYVCADNETAARAEFFVIDDFYTTSNESISLVDGDVISLTCHVTYFGNPFIVPIFYLSNGNFPVNESIDNNTSPRLIKSNTWITARATFYQTAKCPALYWPRCYIWFGNMVGNVLPGSATNTPDYFISIGFRSRSLSCVPRTKDDVISGAIQMSAFYLQVVGCSLVYYIASYYLSIN